MSDPNKKAMYFIQDGFPLDDICGVSRCPEKAIGVFLAFGYFDNAERGSVNLCDTHAAQLATGYFSSGESEGTTEGTTK